MAKARMLHKTISLSAQVNKLSVPARLLFTWMVAHADDDGRLKGEAEYVKAMVVPMTKWSFKKIEGFLTEMHKLGLIIRWFDNNDECFIEFPNWLKFQQIKNDRYKPSDLPSFQDENGNKKSTYEIRDDSRMYPQSNIREFSSSEVNKSEVVADKNIAQARKSFRIVYPDSFEPSNAKDVAAKDVWRRLESDKPLAFMPTYLSAARKGLPESLFYQFASEIEQDSTIKNRGAVFNKKVEDYLAQRSRK